MSYHIYNHYQQPYNNSGYYNSNNNYQNHHHQNTKYYQKQQKQRKREEQEKIKKASEQRKNNLGPGLSAFTNLGNTCYMNSALQCLAHTPMFADYFTTMNFMPSIQNNQIEELAKEYTDEKNPNKTITLKRQVVTDKIQSTLTYQFYKVVDALWSENCIITPRSFKKSIEKHNEEFIGYSQNDSHEVINLILDKINEETSTESVVEFKNISKKVSDLNLLRKKCYGIINNNSKTPEEQHNARALYRKAVQNDLQSSTILNSYVFWKTYVTKHSIISDLFTGLFCSLTRCCDCKNTTTKFEPFTNLSISIPENKNSTLEECLESFSQQETLDGENKKMCDECKKKTKSIKTMIIWELPEILIIQLIRFTATATHIKKNSSFVKFPLNNLSLNKCQIDWHKSSNKYELYAVSNHTGSIQSGHYLAYCKNAVIHKWCEYNDEDVFTIDDDDVEKEIVTGNAYTLFYSKQYDSDDDSDDDLT